MANIKNYLVAQHLRAEPTSHIIQYRRGKVRRSGMGISFWFQGMSTSLVEVPVDDQELTFLFHSRSSDFQDVISQGVISYRIVAAELAAQRIDFSLSLDNGQYRKQPLETMSDLLLKLAQQFSSGYIAKTGIREILNIGQEEVRQRIIGGFAREPSVQDIGVEIVSVRVSAIKPSADLEKALETKTREKIQQEADEAMFERRALAVEKERAIAENELKNQIELACREEELIVQTGQNQRRRAVETSAAKKISAEAEAKRLEIGSLAKSTGIRLVEAAKVEAERERIAIYRDLPGSVMAGLAARELASKLRKIEHLNLSPDMFGPTLMNLMNLGTKRLAPEEK